MGAWPSRREGLGKNWPTRSYSFTVLANSLQIDMRGLSLPRGVDSFDVELQTGVTATPEPGGAGLFSMALLSMVAIGRSRRLRCCMIEPWTYRRSNGRKRRLSR